MFLQVYFHKTRRYLDKLLTDNILEILPDSKYPDGVNEFLKWNDYTVLEKIKDRSSASPIATQFMEREIMPCVYQSTAHSNKDTDHTLFRIIKQTLEEKLNCAIMEDTASKLAHKIPTLEEYDASSGKGIPIFIEHLDRPSSIGRESRLLSNLTTPINIKRLYVERKYSAQAKAIVRRLLNEEE